LTGLRPSATRDLSHALTIDAAFARRVLPMRAHGAHKWGVGGLVIVAGSPSFIGAAALCAMAAGRAGAGVVNVAVPRGHMGPIVSVVPEAAFIPLPESDLESSFKRARQAIADKLSRSKAAVVGPGLGEDEYADALLSALFGRRAARGAPTVGFRRGGGTVDQESASEPLFGGDIPAVIDADGLNWLSKQDEWWTGLKPRSLVLTPHLGEMARLTGVDAEEIAADPVRVALESAQRWGQIVVLKFAHTLATDGAATYVASTAPTSLASAGTGDILAGAIGAMLAQGVEPLDAAALAIYLGTVAAKKIEELYGVLGLVASDLPAAIAVEIAALEASRDESK
jgi:NAD(P)H-hydrate epimerase